MKISIIRNYIKNGGLCALPCNCEDKYPSMLKNWRKYMQEFPSEIDLRSWRRYEKEENGICVICGKISGGLEVIDIDNHLNNAEQIFSNFIGDDDVAKIISDYDLAIEETQSGGYHIFYRCDVIGGNAKLARQKNKTIIETRGEGGLIVCSPTKKYNIIAGDLLEINKISENDREILLNKCKIFDEKFGKDKKKLQPPMSHTGTDSRNDTGERPGDLYNKNCLEEAKGLLRAHGWTELQGKHWRRPGKTTGVSATFGHIAPDVFYPFSSNSSPFEEGKCYHPFDIYVTLCHAGDYSAAAKELAKRFKITKKNSSPKKKKNIKKIERDDDVGFCVFWTWGERGGFKINYFELKKFLEANGFYRYEINKDKFMFLHIRDNIAEEKNFYQLRDFILNYLQKIDKIDVYNEFMDSSKFNENTLSIVECAKIDWARDGKNKAFLFFRNCVVETSKNEIKTYEYNKLKKTVWKSQILNRDFKIINDDEIEKSDVYKFANIVSDYKVDRISAYRASIGFLLHTYKKASFCPVIVYNDENTTDEPTGGTGKGLTVKFVEQLRNLVTLDGKNFDFKNQFGFQQVSQDTNIVFFDDAAKKFDFEKLFSMITTGMTIRKLYLGEVFLPFNESPKFAITTNYAIKSKGDSFIRRIFEIEIHKYFTPTHTPEDEFHRDPFSGWDEAEWLRFDNFMVGSLKHYLNVGLVAPKYEALAYNKLKVNTHVDFVPFAEDNLKVDNRYNKKDALADFRLVTDDSYYKNLGTRRFTEWCKCWADYNGWNFDSRCGAGGAFFEFSEKNKKNNVGEKIEKDPFDGTQTEDDINKLPF